MAVLFLIISPSAQISSPCSSLQSPRYNECNADHDKTRKKNNATSLMSFPMYNQLKTEIFGAQIRLFNHHRPSIILTDNK